MNDVWTDPRDLAMWAAIEAALIAMLIDGSDPPATLVAIEAAVGRRVDGAPGGLRDAQVLAPAAAARLGRVLDLVASAPRRGDDDARELRHDVGSALTAVIASLEVAIDALDEQGDAARREVATAVAYARDSASRAVAGFQRLAR